MKTSRRILIGLIAIASLVLCVMSLLHVPWVREVFRWASVAMFLAVGMMMLYNWRLGFEGTSTQAGQLVAVILGLSLLFSVYDIATTAPGVADDYFGAFWYFLIALLSGWSLIKRSPKDKEQAASASYSGTET